MYTNDEFMPRHDADGEGFFEKLFGEQREGCDKAEHGEGWGLKGYPLAMVYSPLQSFDGLYDCEKGLARGTIFEGLDLPFLGASQCNICGGNRND